MTPFLELSSGPESNLPICCRRNGAHHCTGILTESSGSGINLSAIPQRCPAYPAVVTQVRHGKLSLPAASLIFTRIIGSPVIKTETTSQARIALDLSHQKRGPPTKLL
jgi:hypothetical protein